VVTDAFGGRWVASTSSFGYFMFFNLPTGRTYSINVSSKRYRFTQQDVLLLGNMSDLQFLGQQ
jgi:hypothetical protein